MIGFMIELTLGFLIIFPITMFVVSMILNAFGIYDETEAFHAAREELEHERYRREEAVCSSGSFTAVRLPPRKYVDAGLH